MSNMKKCYIEQLLTSYQERFGCEHPAYLQKKYRVLRPLVNAFNNKKPDDTKLDWATTNVFKHCGDTLRDPKDNLTNPGFESYNSELTDESHSWFWTYCGHITLENWVAARQTLRDITGVDKDTCGVVLVGWFYYGINDIFNKDQVRKDREALVKLLAPRHGWLELATGNRKQDIFGADYIAVDDGVGDYADVVVQVKAKAWNWYKQAMNSSNEQHRQFEHYQELVAKHDYFYIYESTTGKLFTLMDDQMMEV